MSILFQIHSDKLDNNLIVSELPFSTLRLSSIAGRGLYQLKIVWAHYGTPLGWVLLFNDDKGLKSQCCTGLLLMMSIAGLTSVKLVIDVINDIYCMLKFAVFFI